MILHHISTCPDGAKKQNASEAEQHRQLEGTAHSTSNDAEVALVVAETSSIHLTAAGEGLHVSQEKVESVPLGDEQPAVLALKQAWAEEKWESEDDKPEAKTDDRDASAHLVDDDKGLLLPGEAVRPLVGTKSVPPQQEEIKGPLVREVTDTILCVSDTLVVVQYNQKKCFQCVLIDHYRVQMVATKWTLFLLLLSWKSTKRVNNLSKVSLCWRKELMLFCHRMKGQNL